MVQQKIYNVIIIIVITILIIINNKNVSNYSFDLLNIYKVRYKLNKVYFGVLKGYLKL